MIEDSKCCFTGEKAESQTNRLFDAVVFDSTACGVYAIHKKLLQTHPIKSVIDGLSSINQASVNCAKRSLEIRSEGLIPYWVLATDVENVKKILAGEKGSSNFVVCEYEETAHQEVDHSAKPMAILNQVANRLKSTHAFERFSITITDIIMAGIPGIDEATVILRYLTTSDLLQLPASYAGHSIFQLKYRMTISGWNSIRSTNESTLTNKVFIATQFVWPENDNIRIEAINAIKSACRKCGYVAEVVSQGHTGNITDRILSEIRKSRFVVAELTYNNRGVYFESGFARGLGQQVFHVIKQGFTNGSEDKGMKVHFDIQQIMYREWTTASDLETKLEDWIMATVGPYTSQLTKSHFTDIR